MTVAPELVRLRLKGFDGQGIDSNIFRFPIATRRPSIVPIIPLTYDWTVGAIGPFELTEYLAWPRHNLGALAVTAPFRTPARPVPATR